MENETSTRNENTGRPTKTKTDAYQNDDGATPNVIVTLAQAARRTTKCEN